MESDHAVDVAAAQRSLEAGGVDFVLSELTLSGGSGIDLTAWIREQPHLADLPVLLLSAQPSRDDIVAASKVAVAGFVAKPYAPEQLRQRILEVYRKHRSQHWQRDASSVWRGQVTVDGTHSLPSALTLFGEGVGTEQDLADPSQRPVTEYLALARSVMLQLEDSGTSNGYAILSSTTDVILALKRPGVRDAVRVALVSTRCQGNPTLMARLFSINRRSHQAVLYLVYDEVDEIPAVHRQGLKDLGVRVLRRGRIDVERMHALLKQHLAGDTAASADPDAEEELPPQQIRSRIVEDIDTMSTLPPIPQVYEKISQMARDPGSDLKDWIEVIRVDPLTCASILRQANSVNSGFRTDVTQIDRAVILLGKNVVVGLVASTAMRTALSAIEEKGFRLEELWLHNLSVGFAAHILSFPLDRTVEGLGNVEALGLAPESLYTLQEINLPRRLGLDYERVNAMAAGSLHDIGKGVMVFAYPGLYPLIREDLHERGWQSPMLEAEREVAGGLTHTVAGDILVRRWNMTEQVGNSVAAHHSPDVDDGLSFLVGMADVVGQILYPFPRDSAYPLARALEDEDWDTAAPFLPSGFLDQPLVSPAELATLVRTVGPRVRHFTEEMRRSLEG